MHKRKVNMSAPIYAGNMNEYTRDSTSEKGMHLACVTVHAAIDNHNLKAILGVINNSSIGGAIERTSYFTESVPFLLENGSKTIIVPMENLFEMFLLPASILGKTDALC